MQMLKRVAKESQITEAVSRRRVLEMDPPEDLWTFSSFISSKTWPGVTSLFAVQTLYVYLVQTNYTVHTPYMVHGTICGPNSTGCLIF